MLVLLAHADSEPTPSAAAKSGLQWGKNLDQPVYGCMVIFTLAGSGDVAFVVGEDRGNAGNLAVLGQSVTDDVYFLSTSINFCNYIGYQIPNRVMLLTVKLPVQTAIRL